MRPGETLDITLYWQGLKPIEKNYSLGIRLLGRGDVELYKLDTYPGGGMWQTTLWKSGEVIADHYRLRLPSTPTLTQVMPSVLKLDVSVFDFVTNKPITQTFDLQGNPSSRQFYEVASIGLRGSVPVPAQATSHLDKAKLMSATTRQEGRKIVLTTTWLCTADVNADYTLFMQLFDVNQTQRKPQADGPLVLPVRWWRTGDVIVDERTLELTPDISPGQYAIKFGLYNKDGQRMNAFDAQGVALPDNALMTEIEIGNK